MYSLRSANYKDIEQMQAVLTRIYGANGYGTELKAYIDLTMSGKAIVRVLECRGEFVGFIAMYRDFDLEEGFIAHCYVMEQERQKIGVNRRLLKLIRCFMSGLKVVVQLDRAHVKMALKNHLEHIENQEYFLRV